VVNRISQENNPLSDRNFLFGKGFRGEKEVVDPPIVLELTTGARPRGRFPLLIVRKNTRRLPAFESM